MNYPRRKLSEHTLLWGWLRIGVFELQDGTQEVFLRHLTLAGQLVVIRAPSPAELVVHLVGNPWLFKP